MLQIPALRPETAESIWNFEKLNPNPMEYRHLCRAIGEDWLWVSRLLLNDNEPSDIIGSPDIEIYKLASDTEGVWMLELDFRQEGECELTFFGISKTSIEEASRTMVDESGHRTCLVPSDQTILVPRLYSRPPVST